MPRKYSDEQIGFALRQAEAGTPVEAICRKLWGGGGHLLPLAPRVQPGPAAQRSRLPPARPRSAGDPTSPPRPLGRPEGRSTNLSTGTTIGGRSLTTGTVVRGVTPDGSIEVVRVKWYGDSAVELTYKVPTTGRNRARQPRRRGVGLHLQARRLIVRLPLKIACYGPPATTRSEEDRPTERGRGHPWRREYNQVRPHSALGSRPPAPAAIEITPPHPAPWADPRHLALT